MPPDRERDYEVGYRKPPGHTRFTKGRSGNPRGRSPKREAIITKLVNRSATADLRAIKILLDMLRDIEGQAEPASPETSAFSEADEKVIEQLRARFSKAEK